MLVVSLLSFAANQLLYLSLLRFTALDYRASLVIVLITVAAGTFAATRGWVFRLAHRISSDASTGRSQELFERSHGNAVKLRRTTRSADPAADRRVNDP